LKIIDVEDLPNGFQIVFNFQKVLQNPVIAKDGFLYPPEGPGHGLHLDEEAVEFYKLD